MDILELLKNRYSVRDFKPDDVPSDYVEKILEAGRVAPTAKNLQPQKIYVLESDEAIEKIRAITPSAYNAPIVFLICADTDIAWTRTRDSWSSANIDSAIVTCHMMLEAESLGLGSVWVCAFDPEKVKSAFDLPENILPFSLLPMGFRSDECEPNPRHFERKEMGETVKKL